jgi:hypothetical protein
VQTLRKDMDSWFESVAKHCDRNPPSKTDFRRYLYNVDDPRSQPKHVKHVHQKHIDDVRAYATKQGIPLLEVCFEQGDGWEKLCPFLEKPVPEESFPWLNRVPTDPNSVRHSWLRLRKRVLQ